MRALRRVWFVTLGLLIAGGFYLLLIDTASLPELYALAGVAVACALAFVLAREQGFAEARVDPRWLLRGWRVLIKVPLYIVLLCREALVQLVAPRQVRGSFRAAAFGAVKATPEDAGRRAVSEWLGSLSPNTIVIGVDPERGLVLVHELRRRADTEKIDPLGLG
jgi:multisubunit Na+/H+ antiporter MnhE subunit